jgi:hypothetical protein
MPDEWGEAYVEVYYPPPIDESRERRMWEVVSEFGGVLYDRDPPEVSGPVAVWFEFASYESAAQAADALHNLGEHEDACGSW